jgi:hypothetical protein
MMGADVIANIGRLDELQSSEFHSTLGQYGFPKRNSKGKGFLTVYLTHPLRVMNTFFRGKADGPGYGTWSSNRPTSTGQAESHMLDLIVCSTTLHKHVRNWQVAIGGADSDHRAVQMQLNLTLLKYKEKASINGGEIDLRKICKEDKLPKLCNKYLLGLTTRNMTYDNFCEAVVRAGWETALSIECQSKQSYSHPSYWRKKLTALLPTGQEPLNPNWNCPAPTATKQC